ncbi:MAG: ribonuclease P protein component [Patescibacteria group bacterium]
MLPRKNRLPSPEIKSIMRAGWRTNGDGVSLIYRKRIDSGNPPDSRNLKFSRFAFVVPVSVDKRAVGRNRLKRLARESVRLALSHLAPGWDGIFMVRKGLGEEFGVVDGKVRELLGRAGMLNESIMTQNKTGSPPSRG